MILSITAWIYIVIIIVFLIGLIWIWTKIQPYLGYYIEDFKDTKKEAKIPEEILFFEQNYPLHLRSYIQECTQDNLTDKITLKLLKEDCTAYLDACKDIFTKEHYFALIPVQSQKWRLHIESIDAYFDHSSNKQLNKISTKMRSLNRKIVQIHEKYLGLSFDSALYLRDLNVFDSCLQELCEIVIEEEDENDTNKSNSILEKFKELRDSTPQL